MKIGQFIIQNFVNDAFMNEDEQYPIVNDIGRWSKIGLNTTQIKGSAATNEPYTQWHVIGQNVNEREDFNVVFSEQKLMLACLCLVVVTTGAQGGGQRLHVRHEF